MNAKSFSLEKLFNQKKNFSSLLHKIKFDFIFSLLKFHNLKYDVIDF